MRRNAAAFLVLVFAAIGCIERRMVVVSDPPGALVLHNGQPIGNAPGDDHFTYYGVHHFTLIRPGFQTLQVDQRIRAPWYEFFPLDLVTEGLVPLQLEDVRRFSYQMQPLPGVRPEEVSDRANILRQRGKQIQEPSEGTMRSWGRRNRATGATNAGTVPVPPPISPSGPPVAMPPPPNQNFPATPLPPAMPVPPAGAPPIIGSGPMAEPGISPPG